MPLARITITGVGPEPAAFEIEDETVIGRSMRADIQIDGDLVSRLHARIYPDRGRWLFEDLGSRNGSLLNGARATKSALESGDVINIGYAKVHFEQLTLPSSSFAVSIVDQPADLAAATIADSPTETSGATLALSYKDLVQINQRITTIVRISQKLATLLDRDELLEEVLTTLFDLFTQAKRSAVVLRDADGVFQVVATRIRGAGSATMSVMRISTSLIQFVRREGKAVLSADTAHDDRFAGKESIVGGAGRSIMCAPLLHDQDFLGIVYLDTETLLKPFTHNDLNLMQGVAGPLAVFIKNTQLVQRIERETKLSTSLSRYLSPEVVRQIGDGRLTANLGGDQTEGTVMFSDIVGFTAMSERLAPGEVVDRLNRYFTSMLQAVFGWEGTVDKFGGDAILAVWGAPVPNEEHALLATAAALEMQGRLFELNLALAEAEGASAADGAEISMAVGLNSGRFVAGNIGGEERIEWTVIGDTVNVAQRVESQGFAGCVLVSDTTAAEVTGAVGGYSFPPVSVKNRAEPVTITSVRTLRTPQGVVAAVPATVVTRDGAELRSIIASVRSAHPLRITVRAAGELKPGQSVKIIVNAGAARDVPEAPGALTASGRVTTSAPLLLSTAGRSAEIDVTQADEAFEQLLTAGGVSAAATGLDDIER